MSAIERLICLREMSLIGSISLDFAQNTIHYFQNTALNSSTNATKTATNKKQRHNNCIGIKSRTSDSMA